MRKEAGFEVMDMITVYVDGNDKVAGIVTANADDIKVDVMASDIVSGQVDGYSKEWNINGETVVLGVKKN
jgi:isoleucyl-tRNA synthetase